MEQNSTVVRETFIQSKEGGFNQISGARNPNPLHGHFSIADYFRGRDTKDD